jgi:LacI family transcriptional regulator
VAEPITLADVARRAQVHPATASRALDPKQQGRLSGQTVERVAVAARELGYAPNAVARALRTSRTHTVGILLPDLTNPIFPPLIRGVEDVLAEQGYTALIANTDGDPGKERTATAALRARQVDGFLVATAWATDPTVAQLRADGVPLVLANRTTRDATPPGPNTPTRSPSLGPTGPTGPGIPTVLPDDRDGIGQALEHLHRLRHRAIAHLAGPATVSSGLDRAAAFRDRAAALGLSKVDAPVVDCDAFSIEAGERAMRTVLRASPSVTAVVAANDLIAVGALDAIVQFGLRCPRDISVVGYNDMPLAAKLQPALTTIRVDFNQMGRLAARLLLTQLGTDRPHASEAALGPGIVLPVALTVRESTAPLPRRRPAGQPAAT